MKSIFIEKDENYTRAALNLNNKLEQLFIEEKQLKPHVGQIYMGVVKNIVGGNKCAYVDIGYSKNCYMHLEDFKEKNIKKGDHLIVEILKEEIGDKGPKITSNISVQGTYCVVTTFNNRINYSKNIEDRDIKKSLSSKIEKPQDIGIIVRTRGVEVSHDCINREISYLYEIYSRILKEGTYALKPKLLYDNGKLCYRILRDYLDDTVDEIVTNDSEYYEVIKEFVEKNNNLVTECKLHQEKQNLFGYYGIEKEIMQLKNDKVYLNSGAYIVINKTEAMNVIDVNTGKNTKHDSMRNSVLSSNLEAAHEVVRQVTLRNLSGIIIVDFIDMFHKEDKDQVIKVLEDGFREDKNKVKIYPFTQLGLIQITRKRTGNDIYSYIDEKCPRCKGNGSRLKLSYISFLIRNEIYKIEKQLKIENIYIEIDQEYKKDISEDIITFVKNIDALDKKVYIQYVNNSETFKIEPLIFESQIKNLESYKVYS